jgi:hypothetical protein
MGTAADQLPVRLLRQLDASAIRNRQLPEALRRRGFKVDPTFTRNNNINHVIKFSGPSGQVVYAKTEENEAAIRAEALASHLWRSLGWKGLPSEVVVTNGGDVLVVPAVGTAEVSDDGDFLHCFAVQCPFETETSMLTDRPEAVLRVELADLDLRDEDDVLRFVVLNAIWGNSDRHVQNLRYGWVDDPVAAMGGHGYLLPIDHGKCFFNNVGVPRNHIAGTPSDAVTGKLGNPHQLLRAFTERVAQDRASSDEVLRNWLESIKESLAECAKDPAWASFSAEIEEASHRCDMVLADLPAFVAACEAVVK